MPALPDLDSLRPAGPDLNNLRPASLPDIATLKPVESDEAIAARVQANPDLLDIPGIQESYTRTLSQRMDSAADARVLQSGDAPIPYSEQIPRTSEERAARTFYNTAALTGKLPEEATKTGREPLVNLPRITGQIVHDALSVLTAHYKIGVPLSQTLADQPPEAPSAVEQIVAGSVNAINATAESLTTPENIAILPIASEATLAKPISAYFYSQMLKSLPEAAQRAGEASATGTPEQKAEAYVSLGVHMGMAALAGSHAALPATPKAVTLARELTGSDLVISPIRPIAPITREISLPDLRALAPKTAEVVDRTTELPKVEPKPEAPPLSISSPSTEAPKVDTPVDLEAHRRALLAKAAEYDRQKQTTITDVTPPGYGPETPAEPSVPAVPSVPAETPPIVKVQTEVTKVAKTEGQRSAADIKSELIEEIQQKLQKAPADLEGVPVEQHKVTIDIPGDGTFTVPNTIEAISGLLERAKKIKTDAGKAPGVPRKALKVNPKFIDFEAEAKDLNIERTQKLNYIEDRKALENDSAKQSVASAQERIVEIDARLEKLRPYLEEKAAAIPEPETQNSKLETNSGSNLQSTIATPGPPLAPTPAPPIPLLTPKSQRQIITDLARGLKVPIRFGRLRLRSGGYYVRLVNLITSKRANDVPVSAHEAGHRLDAVFNFSSDPALRTELNALGDPNMPGSRSSWTKSKTVKYKLGEGVAEFVRHWLTDPIVAQRHAPNMLRAFEAALDANKDFGDTMRQAQIDIKTWRDATPQARLRSHISVGGNPNKTPYTLSQLTRDVVDDLHFLRLAVDDAKSAGATIPSDRNPYLLARNLRGSYGMAESFIRNGIADFRSKAVTLGTSLEHALKPVAGRIADFRDWIVAKRALELHRQGRETGLVHSDVQFTVAKFDADPAFHEAFNKIKAWNDALLQYATDSGLVTPGGASAMRQMNHDYVPLHRIFEVGAGEPPAIEGDGTGRGLNVGTPGSLKRLHGSPRDIVDPLETMVRNAYAIITASEKSAINRAVADLARAPDMGKWVELIGTPKDQVKVGLEKIRGQLEDAGADLTQVPDDLLLQFFQNSKHAPFGENTIKIVRDGKPEFYRLKRELFETFHALDLEDSGTLVRILSQPAQVLRSGVVLDPAFALANAIRDAFSSAIVSRHGMLPFEAVARGVTAMLRDPKLIAEWEASGGKNSVEASYFDREKLQAFLRQKITKDLSPAERALIAVKSPLQALRWLTSISEEATRIGEYQKALTDLTKNGVPEGEARRLAAFESRDRQDFAKGGAKTKIIRRLAAFWNAGLQANVRLAQAFHERPFQTTLRGIAFITIPKMLEQQVNWDDPDYWDRPQWERDLFFLIPAGKGADGHTRFIRIPTPFEAGIIFGTLPGRILQTIREKDARSLKSFPLVMATQSIPNPTPQFAMTMFEDFMIGKKGYDVYRQRQIVPESLAQLPPEMQWTEQTSLTAKKLGSALGFSPMKIDHIIAGTTGGLGRQVTHQLVDRAIAASTGDQPTAKGTMPGARFLTTPSAVSSQAIEDFYTTLDQIKTAAAGEKKGKDDELAGYLKPFTATEHKIAKLRKEMRASETESDKNAAAEEILEMARETMKEYRATRKTAAAPETPSPTAPPK